MSKREPIQKLPDEVINKIAAGEVVERPASVVKELLENARDAGATQIDIHIERGGIDLIRIIDNGWGMSKEQACLSLERHATSKIQSEADIEEIQTLGFRGEALAAIASVSQFSMTTRPETQTAGTQITRTEGNGLTCQAVGAARGTTIEVRHLFYNVPARRKFLRAPKTELNHIRQLVLLQALSAHQIGFSLSAEGHSVYQLPRCTKPEERIAAIYSPAFLSQLRPISFQHHTLRSLASRAYLRQDEKIDRINLSLLMAALPQHPLSTMPLMRYIALCLGAGVILHYFYLLRCPPIRSMSTCTRPKKRYALDIQIKFATPYRPHFKTRYTSSPTLRRPPRLLQARSYLQRNVLRCRCKMR